MIKLNKYITEAWSGVKKHTISQPIIAWCEEMGIEKYTINSKGHIDVDGDVELMRRDFKELTYKFGRVSGSFSVYRCENLTSLKNCPNETGGYFDVDGCSKLESLEGCPKVVREAFYCRGCKRKFTSEEVLKRCNVKNRIFL